MTSSIIHNPWREFIENCISGDNYFRSSEYYRLLEDLDRGYEALAVLEQMRAGKVDDRNTG